MLGDLLVASKIITDAQLSAVLADQAGLKKYKPLGQILVEKKLVTVRQLNHILGVYRKRLRLGEILVKSKTITKDELLIALQFRKTSGKRLGQVLLKLGNLNEEALQNAVAIQMNVPFVDLDRTTLGSKLERIIPHAHATKHCVVPISASLIEVTIAVKDPSNFFLMAELQTLTTFKVAIVASTEAMICRAIQRVYVTRKLAPEVVTDERVQLVESGRPS